MLLDRILANAESPAGNIFTFSLLREQVCFYYAVVFVSASLNDSVDVFQLSAWVF